MTQSTDWSSDLRERCITVSYDNLELQIDIRRPKDQEGEKPLKKKRKRGNGK